MVESHVAQYLVISYKCHRVGNLTLQVPAPPAPLAKPVAVVATVGHGYHIRPGCEGGRIQLGVHGLPITCRQQAAGLLVVTTHQEYQSGLRENLYFQFSVGTPGCIVRRSAGIISCLFLLLHVHMQRGKIKIQGGSRLHSLFITTPAEALGNTHLHRLPVMTQSLIKPSHRAQIHTHG